MAKQAPQNTYYVIVSQQSAEAKSSLVPISRLIDKEEDICKRYLETQSYAVIRRFAKKANAEGFVGQLHALGVESRMVSDNDLKGHLILYAATANRGQGGLSFRDYSDEAFYCPFEVISGCAVLELGTDGGDSGILIDLYRPNTNITVRLDSSVIDFSQITGVDGDDYTQFLELLEQNTPVSVDKEFGKNKGEMLQCVQDIVTLPSEFTPPPAMSVTTYDKKQLRAANLYSFFRHRFNYQD